MGILLFKYYLLNAFLMKHLILIGIFLVWWIISWNN